MHRNIETASFSSSDDEDPMLFIPTTDMLSQYNREYSLVVRQVQKFLKETTQCIQRFVAFHNFGVNLNLSQLLSNLVNVESSFKSRLSQTNTTQQKDPKFIAKKKYQLTFNRLIQRMTDIFHDLVDCQLQFKKAYFGIKNQQQSYHSQQRIRLSRSPITYSVSSLTKSSTSQKRKLQDYQQNEEKQEKRQAELRATLNQKLKPKTATVQKQCKEEYSTTQNLYRLNQKFDQFISDIKATRSREQKLIQLFNLNRVKKIHEPVEHPTQCMTPSEVSIITPQQQEQPEEQMDSFLDSWRKIRKDSDSLTEHGVQGRRFFKKRGTTMNERK